jgi:hypothetical protein
MLQNFLERYKRSVPQICTELFKLLTCYGAPGEKLKIMV